MSFFKEQFEKNKKQFIGAVIVTVIILIAGSWYYYREKKSHTYYAVFLTNNQVYFGNLRDKDDKYIKLTDVSYLQAPDPSKPEQVQLIRRGTELHSPSGDMFINSSQILFIEELTSASQVSKTIEDYKKAQVK